MTIRRTALWCLFNLGTVIYLSFYVDHLYALGLMIASAILLGHKMTCLQLLLEDRQRARERKGNAVVMSTTMADGIDPPSTSLREHGGPPPGRDWFDNPIPPEPYL